MFADINGTSIYYELHGPTSGPMLALCHSLGTSSGLWDRQVEAAAEAFGGMRILTFDVRGHGRSPVSASDGSIETFASDFLALLDYLDVDRVDFAGVSLGGLLGQWLGACAPNRLRHLVIANTAAKLGTTESWNARIATVTEHGLSAIADGVLGRWFSASFRAREPQTAERFRRVLLDTPVAGYNCACQALRDADMRPSAKEIAVPTLVVAGDVDESTTTHDAAWLADNIPGATMTTLHAAHLANVEASAEFNRAVSQYIRVT
jgi:3-oxoadipate enol-lactonase